MKFMRHRMLRFCGQGSDVHGLRPSGQTGNGRLAKPNTREPVALHGPEFGLTEPD